MKRITIRKTLSASAISLGCMRMAGMTPTDAAALLETSLEAGINFFDHADIYGGGKSESLFAAAAKQAGIAREQMLIQTKCAIRNGFFDFSKEHIITSVENSLKRLDMDYVDILLLHRPDTLMEPEEVAEAFTQLEASGKVRHFGVSNHNAGQIKLLQKHLQQPLIINQLQFSIAHTGLINQGLNVNMQNPASVDHDGSLLEFCRLEDITIQAWSPFQYGFFSGTFMDNESFPALNAKLSELANAYEVSKEAIAIAWILRHPAKIQPIVGTTKKERLSAMARASQVSMSREEWYALYRAAGNELP